MAVTKRQAEQALRQIRKQFHSFLADPIDLNYGPKLVRSWDWLESGPTAWAIVWEGGPYDWAMLAEHGGTTEFGTEVPAATAWPKGTFAEPVTGWAIGVHGI
jgi:hypothetical protein